MSSSNYRYTFTTVTIAARQNGQELTLLLQASHVAWLQGQSTAVTLPARQIARRAFMLTDISSLRCAYMTTRSEIVRECAHTI